MGVQKLTRLRRDLLKRGKKGEAFINNYLIPKLPEHSSGIFSFWKKILVNLNS